VLTEYDGSNNLQRKFIYGNYIDEVLLMKAGENDYYYAHDHLYSPAALIDSSGTVLERCEYDAYGNCSIFEPNFAPDPDGKSDYENPYLFTGRRLDILDNSSLKIQYNRNRYYDYYTGRWLTHDPLGINPAGGTHNPLQVTGQYKEGVNLYEYVGSNPVVYSDAYGLWFFKITTIGWRIKGIGTCWPTGWATYETSIVSPPIGSLGSLSGNLSIFASFGWTDDEETDCRAKWSPRTWYFRRHKDLWPFSTAFVDVQTGFTAPDASGNLSFDAKTYYKAFYNCGVDSTLAVGAKVTYKTYVVSRCKCLKIYVKGSVDATQRSNLGGTATTIGAMAAVYYGAPVLKGVVKTLAEKLAEWAARIPPRFPVPAQ